VTLQGHTCSVKTIREHPENPSKYINSVNLYGSKFEEDELFMVQDNRQRTIIIYLFSFSCNDRFIFDFFSRWPCDDMGSSRSRTVRIESR
jgi:hypothetical protein